ncbi:glutamic-type intramembrane protease PrsW [Mesobacillus sp. AQ2]|jgi:protease PrsW|uniref:glutamic-type intramembrane protease PrsW n=1 Tax=Bacillaceae TaxID=186817 RepID=UPI0011A6B04F|nr:MULTISPECIES: glutamic-type intramembrane protease PrsW [Bacillaceae]MCM3122223.1 glutamic-type intramembrane protease PrsW [Mesobacillus sp. MER 33]MCM3232187.1 glutamic-type intramembrane protease PrsW [Mesobacillus sp. MER 48]WHX39134.1 glutamic-type intramembrane protease PrsW [Mesobacillus sp. AQ2]
MLGIVTAGVAPGLALLSYFYLKDQYDSEPLSLVFKMFIFGALLVFPLMFIQYVLAAEGLFQGDFSKAFGTVGLLEEFFKWFILYYTIFQHIAFDEHYDGIIYSVSVSLGFASAENIFYLLANGLQDAIGRALLPVSSHALFGVIMGYYIGKAKFAPDSPKKWVLLSLSVPVLLHGIYDFILMTREDWMVLMIPFMIFLWWLGLRKVKKARVLTLQHIDKQFPI